MKLTTVSMLSAIAVFVATLPHGVGAWLVRTIHPEVGCVKLFAIQPVDQKIHPHVQKQPKFLGGE